MHSPSSVRHPAVIATAVALPQDAYDFDYYEQRISNTWLLAKSVPVRTIRMPFLAVPVGGTRRGGYYLVSCLCFGLKVRDLLLARPGFPDLRLRWSPYPDTCFVVEWGEEPPTLWGDRDASTLGRFYGYSEAAIAAFITAAPSDSLSGHARTVFPHGTVARRRGPNFPPERTSTMCAHNPPCPTAAAPDREAARLLAHRPEQGWSLLCNGALLFEDTGELLADGRIVAPHRPLDIAGAAA